MPRTPITTKANVWFEAMTNDHLVQLAAEKIASADTMIITAGAGMGVDSGLPDFRGTEGFWNAYPPYRHLGLTFSELANPRWFHQDPEFAWGFYGHRLDLYRKTQPHPGFEVLRRWSKRMKGGVHVFTSNVDGHFQRARFPEEVITEAHGSIHHAQCILDCGVGIFIADAFSVAVDETTFRARSLPSCPRCGGLARPNILMFGDGGWDDRRTEMQHRRLGQWLAEKRGDHGKIVVIELGAGTGVPTVRMFSESLLASHPASLIRVNVREPQTPPGAIGLPMGALAGLQAIDELLPE